jgi:hypothetical protein
VWRRRRRRRRRGFIMLCKIFNLLLAYQEELYDLKEESSEGGTGH